MRQEDINASAHEERERSDGVHLGSVRRYFKKGTLLFTLSQTQRDFLAKPPPQLTQETDRHLYRTATILVANGLISLSGNLPLTVQVTPAGAAALHFYDT